MIRKNVIYTSTAALFVHAHRYMITKMQHLKFRKNIFSWQFGKNSETLWWNKPKVSKDPLSWMNTDQHHSTWNRQRLNPLYLVSTADLINNHKYIYTIFHKTCTQFCCVLFCWLYHDFDVDSCNASESESETENLWKKISRFLVNFTPTDSLDTPLLATIRLESIFPWQIWESLAFLPPMFGHVNWIGLYFVKWTERKSARSFSCPISSKLAAYSG